LIRLRAESAEANLDQRTAELSALRMRNEALTSEAASLADQLTVLDKSEKELQLDRTRKLEELSDLRQRLEVAERREEQGEELARLRSLLSDMSAEHERLQQRLAEGQEEIDRLVHQQQQQPLLQPPPDVTAGGPAAAAGSQHQQQQQQQPDVAALRGQHGNPPDLMPGEFKIRTYIHEAETSVGDPDSEPHPQDPHGFVPPGSGYISQRS
jgi:hypothetical protein